MIRFKRVLILLMIGIGIVAPVFLISPFAWHWWQLWRNDGVYCFPLDEADGNNIWYGEDCPDGQPPGEQLI